MNMNLNDMLNKLKSLDFKKLLSKKPTVVVEIGNDWLKVLEGEITSQVYWITKIKLVKLADIKGPVEDAISSIFTELKLDRHSVIMLLPRHLVTIRLLEFPSTEPNEINDMIDLQIGKQTPYSKEEIISSYRVIDTKREGYTKVMLAIARRKIVSERIETLGKADIDVARVVLSSEGLYEWFNTVCRDVGKLSSNVVALLDIDSNYSDFIVIRDGGLKFTRNMLIGTNHLSEQQNGTSRETFIAEVKSSLSLYQNEEKDATISKIFLSGAAMNIEGLAPELASALGMVVEKLDPLKNIQIKKEVGIGQDVSFRALSISSLIGTAIKGKGLVLDLTPAEERIQRLMDDKRKQLTVMGILIGAIVMMGSLLLLINIYNKNVYIDEVKKKLDKIEADSKEVEKMRMRINLVESQLSAKGASLNMLNEICRLVPKEMYLTNIDIEEKKQAVLKGRALAMSDVFSFIATLENSSYFENVKSSYTTTKKEENSEYAEFEIICSYENR